MASVVLGDMWINLASDLSQHVVIRRAASTWSTPKVGEVRLYASGRARVISQAGGLGQTTANVRTTDMALIATLQSWEGQTVLVRDERGRSAWGVFFDVPQTDDVARRVVFDLTIQHVSHDVSV